MCICNFSAEHESIWSTILEDRIARKCQSTTMSYCLKLKDLQRDSTCQTDRCSHESNSGSDVFENPEIVDISRQMSTGKKEILVHA